MQMKKIFSLDHILLVTGGLVLALSAYILCAFPSNLILYRNMEAVDASDLEERNYNSLLIVGYPAGEGIEELTSLEQLNRDTPFFFTFETESMIPLHVYQVKTATDTNEYSRRHRYRGSTSTVTDSMVEIFYKRNNYDSYYLVQLPSGEYVMAYVDDSYYWRYRMSGKVQLPVGTMRSPILLSNDARELLQPALEEYGLEDSYYLMMFSERHYVDHHGIYGMIAILMAVAVWVAYFVLIALFVLIRKIFKKKS